MTRTFTEHSYKYIQGWLKNQYKTNPEFKRKKDYDTRFYQIKSKVIKKLDMVQLEILSDYYKSMYGGV
jgi:hypothetical protein